MAMDARPLSGRLSGYPGWHGNHLLSVLAGDQRSDRRRACAPGRARKATDRAARHDSGGNRGIVRGRARLLGGRRPPRQAPRGRVPDRDRMRGAAALVVRRIDDAGRHLPASAPALAAAQNRLPLVEALEAGVSEILGEDGVSLTAIPGGASRETWLVRTKAGRLVLRRDPEGSVSLVPISNEFELIRRARAARVPVPEPLALEASGGRLGSEGMLMSFVDGTSVAPRILRKPEFEGARGSLTAQLGQALARIHSIDPGDLMGVLPEMPGDPAIAQISEWERQLDGIGEPLPAVELGLRWLRANAPEPAAPRLVH